MQVQVLKERLAESEAAVALLEASLQDKDQQLIQAAKRVDKEIADMRVELRLEMNKVCRSEQDACSGGRGGAIE